MAGLPGDWRTRRRVFDRLGELIGHQFEAIRDASS